MCVRACVRAIKGQKTADGRPGVFDPVQRTEVCRGAEPARRQRHLLHRLQQHSLSHLPAVPAASQPHVRQRATHQRPEGSETQASGDAAGARCHSNGYMIAAVRSCNFVLDYWCKH